MTTLGNLINKVKAMEEVRSKMKGQEDVQKGSTEKQSFAVFESRKFEARSSFWPSKRPILRRYKFRTKVQAKARVRRASLRALVE